MASSNSNIKLICQSWAQFAQKFALPTEGQDLLCDMVTLFYLIQKFQLDNLQIGFTSTQNGYLSILSNALQLVDFRNVVEITEFGYGLSDSMTQMGSVMWHTLNHDKFLETVSKKTSLMVFFGNIEPAALQHILNCGVLCVQVFSGTSLEAASLTHSLSVLKDCYVQFLMEPQQNPFSWNHINSFFCTFQSRTSSCKRAIVVGDVHGCLDELQLLLSKCEFNPTQDELIMVGDLCGKGPKSKELIKFLREVHAKAVLGNHDVFTMTCRKKKVSGVDVVIEDPTHAYCIDNFGEEDWKWMESLPYYLVLDRFSTIVGMYCDLEPYSLVHAGLLPDVPLEKQDPINMTYMRNILDDGTASKEANNGVPWASVWKGPFHVIFGHDAVRGLQKYPYATGLDTGCCYGGSLTACILPSKRLVSMPALQIYSTPSKPIKKFVEDSS